MRKRTLYLAMYIVYSLKAFFLTKEMSNLLKIALPIVASSILQMAYNVTDMIWVGRLGSDSVAAVGTAGFFINLGWAIASIITVGVNIKVAHAFGANNKSDIFKFAFSGISSIVIVSVSFSIFLYLNSSFLISFFNLNNSFVENSAISYLKIWALGGIFKFLGLFFTAFINAHGYTRLSLKANLIGTILNILLDPILIFYFELGINGAAYATIISQLFALIYFIFIVKHNKLLDFFKFNLSTSHLKKILMVGFPSSIQRLLFIGIAIVIARIIAEWGSTAIAVQKIGVQIEALSYMFTVGVLQAISISIGQKYGAQDYKVIPTIYKEGLKLTLLIGIMSTSMFWIFPETLFSIFVNEPQSISMGKDYLLILGFSQLFMCIEMTTAGGFYGIGKTYFPAIISGVFTSLRIPFAYFLGFSTVLGLNGVWWSISGSSILKGTLLFIVFHIVLKKLIESKRDEKEIK